MATALQIAEVLLEAHGHCFFEILLSNQIMNVTWQTCLHVNASDYLLQDARFSGRYRLHSPAQDGIDYSVQVPAFRTGVLLPSSVLFEGFGVRIMFMDQGVLLL